MKEEGRRKKEEGVRGRFKPTTNLRFGGGLEPVWEENRRLLPSEER
ncbi:MAG: hypothetical protein KME60_32515 [Cyanomargarita calcarea GSE-NOS-MK-12-04C]|jgi:hypothetical protein|uniref:Uncharacterized protein n=1 Tax=Cyanomargarita calcarea GSE-NOS-MK-12-04C TaxID=2839659 RepID=A0A951QT48_9CYAN|nr:hypothetical protein [Cyanomargarita calcarea GSE-NOS-MK-12-04C]